MRQVWQWLQRLVPGALYAIAPAKGVGVTVQPSRSGKEFRSSAPYSPLRAQKGGSFLCNDSLLVRVPGPAPGTGCTPDTACRTWASRVRTPRLGRRRGVVARQGRSSQGVMSGPRKAGTPRADRPNQVADHRKESVMKKVLLPYMRGPPCYSLLRRGVPINQARGGGSSQRRTRPSWSVVTHGGA